MSGGRVSGNPDKLQWAQKEFEAAGQEMGKALDRFVAGAAPLTRDDLGGLAPMDQIWSLFTQFRSGVINTVGTAAWELEVAAAHLGTHAGSYRALSDQVHGG